MITEIAKKFFLSVGSSEGFLPLNAFDGALIDAGVGNTNLVKMSSIIPPGAEQVEPFALPFGSLVPIAYASKTSQIPGEVISAAVACALPEDNTMPGVIMEYSASGHCKDAEAIVRKMAEEALKMRKLEIRDIISISIDHTVKRTGCAFACVVLG